MNRDPLDQDVEKGVVEDIHAGHGFAERADHFSDRPFHRVCFHAVGRNDDQHHQQIHLRTGQDEAVALEPEQREEKVLLIQPGEDIDERNGHCGEGRHARAAIKPGNRRVEEQLAGQVIKDPRPDAELRGHG